jgi:hypothetical protein
VALPAPGAEGWTPLTFAKVRHHTTYTPVEVDGRHAVRAESHCAASALVLPLDGIDLAQTPHLRWQWRIECSLAGADERTKAGDDFAARVYVMFQFDPARASFAERLQHRLGALLYGPRVPGNALNYVWTRAAPAGAHWDSPFAASSKILSLGAGPLPAWTAVEVDVARDYGALFGGPPPRPLALGLMTDSDNTCQEATAVFADFVFAGP